MNILVRPLLLVLLALVAACDAPAMVTSPIAGSMPAEGDERLLGVWSAQEAQSNDRELGLIVVAFDVDDQNRLVMSTAMTVAPGPRTSDLTAVMSAKWTLQRVELGGKRYFSARLVEMYRLSNNSSENDAMAVGAAELKANPIFMLGWPEIDGDGRLVLHVMAEDEIKALKPPGMKTAEEMSKDLKELAETTWAISGEALASLIRQSDPTRLFRGTLGPLNRVSPRISSETLWSVRK